MVLNETAAEQQASMVDAIVVGAGMAGLYALHKLRGLGLRVIGLERSDDIGGTWHFNRFPGARCDVESIDYSYSFSEELEQDWVWTERFAAQPEILSYIHHVAERFELRELIRLGVTATSAHFDDADNSWTVRAQDGSTFVARYCIMATGVLSEPHVPFPVDEFQGQLIQTGQWPHDVVDLAGKRVGVVGTGSTGVQVVPRVAEQADQVVVFQRTPVFAVPARNHPLTDEQLTDYKSRYRDLREKVRKSIGGTSTIRGDKAVSELPPEVVRQKLEAAWTTGGAGAFSTAFTDLFVNETSNAVVADFLREKIRGIVLDESVAELLTRQDYPLGTKRIAVEMGYFDAFNRSNVTLVDVRNDPIGKATRNGLRTASTDYPVDVLILATGFDAISGALSRIDIRGTEGQTLVDHWADGPRAYLGYGCPGFPNLFLVAGPGSPGITGNLVPVIEMNIEWIARCIAYLESQGIERIEALDEAELEWMANVAELANLTLFPRTDSWYLGANIPGKPRTFTGYLGGIGAFDVICSEIEASGYPGFRLGRPDGPQQATARTSSEGLCAHV